MVPLGISELPSPPFRVHYIIYMYCREGAVVFREGDKTVYFFYYLMFPFPVIRGEGFGRFGGVLRQTTLSGPQPFPFFGVMSCGKLARYSFYNVEFDPGSG